MKGKLSEIGSKSKNKNIRDLFKGVKDFKKGYQARLNVFKNENEEFLAILTPSSTDARTILVNY